MVVSDSHIHTLSPGEYLMHQDLWTIAQRGLKTVPAEKLVPLLKNPSPFRWYLAILQSTANP